MTEYKKHVFNFHIAYADTDAGGIVYHARYIEIAERARMDWMDFTMPENGDVGFVLHKLSMKYIRPLRLGDKFQVLSEVVKIGGASFDIKQTFIKDGIEYGILTGTVAYLGSDLRPKRITDEMIATIK